MGTTGQLDDVAVEDVRRFEADFLDHLRRTKAELLGAIRESGTFADETEQALAAEIDSFKHRQFEGSGTEFMPVGDEAEEDAAARARESEQEKIVKQRR